MAYESWSSSAANRASMRGNRSRDTKPELRLRSLLHRRGLRFRVAYRPLPTRRNTADVVFSRAKVALFVDGCYWHGCPQHFVQPRTNSDYWQGKIARNVARDHEFDAALRDAGWTVIRCWEHEDPELVAETVANAVSPGSRIGPGKPAP